LHPTPQQHREANLRLFYTPTLLLLTTTLALAQPVPVHHLEGRTRGFLVVRDEAGRPIGSGEVNQEAHGDRVTQHVLYRFRDGSVDDETATFTQRGTFQLVSDHHIQRGPFFSKPLDLSIDDHGQVTTHSVGPDGKTKDETVHIDSEPGLVNGYLGPIMANLNPSAPEVKLAMLTPTPKPHMMHLAVTPDGHGSFTLGGLRHTATIFRLKSELAGVAGVIAPLVGKEPKDILIWVVEGDAPVLVRAVGQISEGGPVVSIEVAGAIFPH